MERVRNACESCFQKVIPPTLSTTNPNVVSGVKSCQSSNGRQTALFTEFKKDMPVFIFYICFLRTNKSLTSKNERTGKHYSFHFLCRWFSLNRSNTSCCRFLLVFVSFCYYWNAVWICLSVNASTRSFGRRVKRIETSKVPPETSAFVPFHKYQLSKCSLTGEWQPAFRNFSAKEAAFSSLLYTFNANSSTLSYQCCSDSNSVKLLYLISR